jgi:uncharacterized membrane protein
VTTKQTSRFWELDLLRGTAVVMMISFHILYDLEFFNLYNFNLYSGPLLFYVILIASLFLGLVGVSLSISHARIGNQLSPKQQFIKYMKRGFTLIILGMLITLGTWLYLDEGFVIFGILHCIGLSIILAYPFLKYTYHPFFIGCILIILGIYLRTITVSFSWLLWLGFRPMGFYTVDYFPLLPWFGVILIGITIGNIFYRQNTRQFSLKSYSKNPVIRFGIFLGQHSLLIYLLHQPILIGVFIILFT